MKSEWHRNTSERRKKGIYTVRDINKNNCFKDGSGSPFWGCPTLKSEPICCLCQQTILTTKTNIWWLCTFSGCGLWPLFCDTNTAWWEEVGDGCGLKHQRLDGRLNSQFCLIYGDKTAVDQLLLCCNVKRYLKPQGRCFTISRKACCH